MERRGKSKRPTSDEATGEVVGNIKKISAEYARIISNSYNRTEKRPRRTPIGCAIGPGGTRPIWGMDDDDPDDGPGL